MLNINEVKQLYLGIQGENKARPLVIDVKPWLAGHPDANFSIWHTRNGESIPDPTGAVYDSTEGTLTWTPTNVDTYIPGEGEAEIRMYENGVIKKTREVTTCVSESVTGGGSTLGSGWQEYIDAFERAAQVAVMKNGMLKFHIDENGHLILSYTDQVPIPDENGDLPESDPANIDWIEKDLGSVFVDITGKKDKQTPVTDPAASGTALAFIAGITQDANGNITPAKKTVAAMTGATESADGAAGLVPAPQAGDEEKFLRGDGTWSEGGSGGNATVLRCDMGTISSLPVTKYFDDVTSDMTVIWYEAGTPSAFLSALEITTATGSITVSGTINTGASSTLKLTLSTTEDATETA